MNAAINAVAVVAAASSGRRPRSAGTRAADAWRILAILRREHPDRLRGSGGEGAGREIAPVAQLLDGLEHTLAGLWADPFEVVEHPGDRLMGDARARGNVMHAGTARLFGHWHLRDNASTGACVADVHGNIDRPI